MIPKKLLLAVLTLAGYWMYALTPQETEAAREVIARFAGREVADSLKLEALPDADGCPVFEIDDNGRTLRGSSAVALCKAFYTNTLSKRAGVCTWSGSRFDAKAAFAPSGPVRAVSPYRHHQFLNVVTFGYTSAYWDEARWMKEIDWMALHGFDMPLAQIANEAISERVWKEMGLTDKEIDAYFCGPAHLPWLRMGNLSGAPDSPQPKAWRERSVRLQHAVLKRMRELGMKPIVPAFAGFVPDAFNRISPDSRLLRMHWATFHSSFLSPDQPAFRDMGRRYVRAWEKEFGKCTYYLADSFNEMPLPWKSENDKRSGLAVCGANVYGAITDANPDAVWVMQGWMFGYSRHIWTPPRLQALLSRVPEDRILLLDMAVDFNRHIWKNGFNWNHYKGFFNRPWIWSTIPNMGGKSAPNGNLEFYANGHLDALASPNRGRLVGYGTAPEGTENNEIVYELLADAGWRSTRTDLKTFLMNYTAARYGKAPEALSRYWDEMLKSVYGAQAHHPRYAWQYAPGRRSGDVKFNEHYFRAVHELASCRDGLGHSGLYLADLRAELAFALGCRLEGVLSHEADCADSGLRDLQLRDRALAENIFLSMDRLLARHPLFDLRTWTGYARRAAEGNAALADYYETNARRLITIWGPPVSDYAARAWSGMLAGYYLERYRCEWKAKDRHARSERPAFENRWVCRRLPLPALQAPVGCSDIPEMLKLMDDAGKVASSRANGEVGRWSPDSIRDTWTECTWEISPDALKQAKYLRFRYTHGSKRLDIAEVRIVADGKTVFRAEPNGYTGHRTLNNTLPLAIPPENCGSNTCFIRARIRGNGGRDSYGRVELLN